MAASMEDLIEHLLDKITLSRSKGFTAVDFEEAVHSFYKQKNDELETDEDTIIVDEKLIDSAFDRIREHEDVEIQDGEETISDQQDGQPESLQSKLAGKRIFTSEERLWQTIAGHESDLVRVPGMEFELLVVIAQHGPQGCLQSVATQITGQDKHSVPARTDKLVRKGYISKVSVTAKHIRTSLLRLAKWTPSEPAAIMEGGMLRYDALFDTTIALLKENGNIISIDDLYKGLDPKAKSNRKILLRCCQRLSQAGCTRLLRCRVQDEDGNPIMLAHGKGEKTVNAIQLMREPTAEDRSVWVNFRNRLGVNHKRKHRATRNRDSEDDDVDQEEESGGDEDAEGETDDEAVFPPASTAHSRRIISSERPTTDKNSPLTPSRKSNRARKKSSLGQSAEYARLFEGGEGTSDQDAEFEIDESVPPDAATATPPRRKKLGRPNKTAEKDGSARRPRGRPRKSATGPDSIGGENAGFSVSQATPMAVSAGTGGANDSEPPTSSKRQRKKSTKALEADALRAAGEPLLTEPVDGYDIDDDSGADSSDSNDVENIEPDGGTPNANDASSKPKKTRGAYKKRESTKADGKKREPIVKKREILPEEYEEYEKFAQAAAERQVRVEMKSGRKRTASMAQLDDPTEGANKVPRTDEQAVSEEVVDNAEPPMVELPSDRVAEVKASILARDEPGVYINPPGARNTKLENYVQRGRPRNAIIAVVKSDGMRSLPWFKHEGGPRFAPKASRRRTARIGEGLAKFGDDESLVFVEGNGSEGEGEGPTKKRKKLGEGQGRFRIERRSNMPVPQAGELGTFGILGLGLDGAADEDINHDESGAQDETNQQDTSVRRTSRVSRRPSARFDFTPINDEEALSPQAMAGAAEDNSEKETANTQEDPIAAASMELSALQRRKRPRGQDAMRIEVLQRQIELNAAANQSGAEDPEGGPVSTGDGGQSGVAIAETAPVENEDKQPSLTAADQTPVPEPTSGSSEQPNTPNTQMQAELESLLAIKTKQRTPEHLQRIEDLKSRIDDAYINAPGTVEELETLQNKRGRRSVVVTRRIVVLKDQFPEAGKPLLKKRVSLRAGRGNAEGLDEVVPAEDTPATSGTNTPPIETPHGLPTTQTTELPTTKDSKLQAPDDTTIVSVEEAPVSTAKTFHENEPPANDVVIQERSAHPSRQPSTSSSTPKTYPELASGKPSSYPELFTKKYVTEHPDEKFHYRGGGKYARGERFSRAYVDKHPNEKFYRVENQGNVIRFARGDGPGEEAGESTASASPAIDPKILQSDLNAPDAVAGATRRESRSRGKIQAANEVASADRQQDGLVLSEVQDAIPDLSDQMQQTVEPEVLASSIPQDVMPVQTEPAALATKSGEQHTTPIAIEQSPATFEANDLSPTRNDPIDAGSAESRPESKRAKKQTKVDRRPESGPADAEPRFDKAYVEAHPDEHFYHRGKGGFSRGEAVSKAYVDAHPEETFKAVAKKYIRLPVPESEPEATPTAREEPIERTNQELESADSVNDVDTTYTKEYVENHPDETFFHRGGGKWHLGMPPPGSVPRTGVRGPGAKVWKANAGKATKGLSPTRAAARETTPTATPAALPIAAPEGSPAEALAVAESVPPVSSLLTTSKPYSPQNIQKTYTPSTTVVAINDDQPTQPVAEPEPEPAAAVAEADDDVEMAGPMSEEEDDKDAYRGSSPSPGEDEDVNMDEYMDGNEDEDDQYEPPGQDEEDVGDDDVNDDEPEDDDPRPSRTPVNPQTTTSAGQVHFPIDLSAAVIVRRTEKPNPPPKPPARRRSRPQTVSKLDNDEVMDLTDMAEGQGSNKALPQVRKPKDPSRAPARGSKISRDMRLQAQRAWPYGAHPLLAIPAPALALLMHPAQNFHPSTGTFGTFSAATEMEPPLGRKGNRSLRPRATLAKLPQPLEEDFFEAPGLIVKLKVKNLASVLPPDTAFESGLFATNAASDAVPISRITGKPRRPYHGRSKRVTFQVDDSDGDEFRDDGAVEDENMDEDSDEVNVSEDEGTAVARPERRKRSTGLNGELRMRDMASGPAFKDADRLVIAFALVAAICGGLRVEGINWTLIAHALGFRYDGNFLRRRWDHFKRTRMNDVDKLREAIHEPFLVAYQDDDFPRVDFQNLNNTDWPALFDWVQMTVVPHVKLQPEDEGPQVPDLPQSRKEVEEQFEIKEPANLYETRLDEYFVTGTEQNRRSLITRYTYGHALPGELRPKDHLVQDMALLRSWVRAVAVTKQYNYHPEAAAKKLRKFSPESLQQITAEMIENRTFSQEKKSRMLPGRNYYISNECLQSFRRWPPRPDECRFLRFVAQAWRNINTHFQHNDQLSLVPSASDPEYLVLTNMSAQGLIRISTIYPEVKEDYDAPFPKLSPWGYCGPTYETKKVDMSRLKFPIVYTKTAAYKDDHALLNYVPIPLHPPQVEGELGVRIPFWVDIHGNLIDDVWDMVLRSVLHLLVFRSGSTATMIEQAHGRKLWTWEIELVLEWMREVGIAERVGAGSEREDGGWSGGWKVGEWWYCAFSPEVARWKAPAVVD